MTEYKGVACKDRIHGVLFGHRIIVSKGTRVIANLPVLAGMIAALFALRLTICAVLIALILGYRFTFEHHGAKSRSAAYQEAASAVKAAVSNAAEETGHAAAHMADQVKSAVENIKQEIKAGLESWDGVEDHH